MHDILIRARELIADPAHWHQGEYTGDGAITDPETKCFCIIGAVDRAVLERIGLEKYADHDGDYAIDDAEGHPDGSTAIRRLQQFVPGLVSDFNDDPKTTHADVIGLLDKAIANV